MWGFFENTKKKWKKSHKRALHSFSFVLFIHFRKRERETNKKMMMAEESSLSSSSSSSSLKTPLFLFLKEGFEGASAAAFARAIVDLFSKIKTTVGTNDDDDDGKDREGDEEGDDKKDDDNETKKKQRRQRIVRLFAEDFLYFSLVSVVDDVKKRKNSSQSRGDDDVNIFVKEALRRYAIAGTISTALMVPLDIISFRVKRIEAKMKKNDDNDRSNGKRSRSRSNRVKLYVSAMKQLIKRDGAFAFHKGFSQSVPLIISHTINFAAFDAMKMKYGKKNLTMIESFVIGCLAKSIATGITFPLERTRALVEASKVYHREEEENSVRKNMVDGEKYKSKNKSDSNHGFQGSNAIDVVQLVLESQGVCGFYDGVFRHVKKSVHASALFFVIREQIRNLR